MEDTIFISGVTERDIDLLLLEEFMATPDFCSWFVAKAGLHHLLSAATTKAMRSVTSSNGESDLEVEMRLKDGTTFLLLIENKVSAGFQPNQAERYQERGKGYIEKGITSAYTTVLIAPQVYFQGASKGFDVRLNYEALLEWFASCTSMGNRRAYKLSLLRSAIERSSRGYQMIPSDAVSQFWYDYWLLVSEVAPEFHMGKPGVKPSDSTFVYFREAGLPKGQEIVHKLIHGHFDVQLAGEGDQLPKLEAKYRHLVYKGLEIVKATGSAAIRATVPKLDVQKSLDSQKAAATDGVREGLRLFHWWKDIADAESAALGKTQA